MPRFVVLQHEVPDGSPRGSHWDLMLEEEHDLATWALDTLPGSAELTLIARRLPAHRLAYLTYEGLISGNRGHVRQHDAGDFEWETRAADVLRVQLHGHRLRGGLTLRPERPDAQTWTLHWEPA